MHDLNRSVFGRSVILAVALTLPFSVAAAKKDNGKSDGSKIDLEDRVSLLEERADGVDGQIGELQSRADGVDMQLGELHWRMENLEWFTGELEERTRSLERRTTDVEDLMTCGLYLRLDVADGWVELIAKNTFLESVDLPFSGTVIGDIGYACDAGAVPPASGPGEVAVIQRGGDPDPCPFWVKLENAAAAGYAGAIVYNNVPETNRVRMNVLGSPAIPAVFISREDKEEWVDPLVNFYPPVTASWGEARHCD